MSTAPEPTPQPDSQPGPSRRRLAHGLLLGGAAAGVAAVASASGAEAAPTAVTPWRLTGNAPKATDFLGTTNVQSLVFKTSASAGNPVERARFYPTGELWIQSRTGVGGYPAPSAQLSAFSPDADGIGVLGTAPNNASSAISAIGVEGRGTTGVKGGGEYMGVVGNATDYAVFGYTTPDTSGVGVYGRGGLGVFGRSYAGSAVYGETDSGTGVRGESYSDGGAVNAVSGQCYGAGGTGVMGQADNGSTAFGVWGRSTTGYAGYFSGKVAVTGLLSKGGGSFRIDHPIDPEHKYLSHSFVESPDMMNVYNGNVRTDAAGRAVVTLPDYFMALNRDFRYQLTVIGDFSRAMVSREVADNTFVIRTESPRVKVSWQVTGIRQDAFANAHRVPEVEVKPAHEQGTYLHPEAHGKAATLDVQHARTAALAKAARPRRADPVAAG